MNGILSPPLRPKRPRIAYLDSARALAALSTVVWHTFTAFYDIDHPTFVRDSPLHFFWYGDADVTFFFIHSGFILTYCNRQFLEGISGASLVQFLVSRAFRIYPLYLLVLLCSHLIHVTVYPLSSGGFVSAHLSQYWDFKKSWFDVLKEAVLVVRMPADSTARYMPQDWTLSVELLVSAFLPLLSFIMQKKAWLGCVLVLVLAKLPGLTTFLLEFGIGVALFHFMERTDEYWHRMHPVFRWLVAAVGAVGVTCLFHFSDYLGGRHLLFGLTADRLLVTAGCALCFIVILHSKLLQRVLSIPFLVRLGEVCYGLYLWHLLLLIVFADLILQLLAKTGLPVWADRLILLGLIMAATCVLSLVFFYLVERPLNRAGKRLGAGIGRRLSAKNLLT